MGLIQSKFIDLLAGASQGDILYRGASAWQRLAKGTDGQVLSLASGLPSWADAAGGGTTILTAIKSADEIYGTNVYQDDNHLFLTLEASKTYQFELVLFGISSYNQDLYIKFTAPNGTTIAGFTDTAIWTDTLGTIIRPGSYFASLVLPSSGVYIGSWLDYKYFGFLSTLETAGTLQLQWYPGGNNSFTLKKGSYLKLTQVG